MIASYRDPRYAASIRIEQLRERRRDVADAVPDEVVQIHARRVARAAAGAVAVAGFVLMALASLAEAMRLFGPAYGVPPTLVLVAALVLSLGVHVVARRVAAIRFERRVRAAFDGSGDELSRLARLESDAVRRAAVRLAGEGERRSIALPMVGISLLGPLAMHLVVWCVVGGAASGGARPSGWLLDSFDWWIAASLLLVGVAHVVLACLCVGFARKVERASLAELEAGSFASGWRVLGWTVLASLVPGVIAFLIPPVVVFFTGVLFIPWMFSSMHRRALTERRALAAF